MNDEKKKPGRPRVHSSQDSAMDNYNVRMTAWQARMARKIGDGSLSAGIREAIEYAVKNKEVE